MRIIRKIALMLMSVMMLITIVPMSNSKVNQVYAEDGTQYNIEDFSPQVSILYEITEGSTTNVYTHEEILQKRAENPGFAVPNGTNVEVRIQFNPNVAFTADDTVIYNLPNDIYVKTDAEAGEANRSGNVMYGSIVAGTYTISDAGVISISWEDGFIAMSQGLMTNGMIRYKGKLNYEPGDDDTLDINFPGTTDPIVVPVNPFVAYTGLKLDKGVYDYENRAWYWNPGSYTPQVNYDQTEGCWYALYGVQVTLDENTNTTARNVIVKDEFLDNLYRGLDPVVDNLMLDSDGRPIYYDVKVKVGYGEAAAASSEEFHWSDTHGAYIWKLGDIDANDRETRELTYRVKLSDNIAKLRTRPHSGGDTYKEDSLGQYVWNNATGYIDGVKKAEDSVFAGTHFSFSNKKTLHSTIIDEVVDGNPTGNYILKYTISVTNSANSQIEMKNVELSDYTDGSYNHKTILGFKDVKISSNKRNTSGNMLTMENAWTTTDSSNTFYNPVCYSTPTDGIKQMHGYLKNVLPGETITITYNMIIAPDYFTTQAHYNEGAGDAVRSLKNTFKAKLESGYEYTAQASFTPSKKEWVEKVSETRDEEGNLLYSEDGKPMVKYEVKVNEPYMVQNPSSTNPPAMPILSANSALNVTDTLGSGWVYCDSTGNTEGSVHVQKYALTTDGKNINTGVGTNGVIDEFDLSITSLKTSYNAAGESQLLWYNTPGFNTSMGVSGGLYSDLEDTTDTHKLEGGYYYVLTYYAKQGDGSVSANISNSAGIGVGIYERVQLQHKIKRLAVEVEWINLVKNADGISSDGTEQDWSIIVRTNVQEEYRIEDTRDANSKQYRVLPDSFEIYREDTSVYPQIESTDYTITYNPNGSDFTITFLNTIVASNSNPIIIKYKTQAAYDITGAALGTSHEFINNAKLISASGTESSTNAKQTFYKTKVIEKTVNNFWEDCAMISWYVDVNQYGTLDGTATLVDTLPEGLKYYTNALNDDGTMSDIVFISQNTGSGVPDVTLGTPHISEDGRTLTVDINGLTPATGEDDMSKHSVRLQIETLVIDDDFFTDMANHTYTNKAEIIYNNQTWSDTASLTKSYDPLSKSGSHTQDITPYIKFTVIVNVDGYDMLQNEDKLVLTDTLDPRMKLVLNDSIHPFTVTAAQKDAEGRVWRNNRNRINYNRPLTQGTENGFEVQAIPAENKFVLTVPDHESLKVEYYCLLNGKPGDTLTNLTNTISLNDHVANKTWKSTVTISEPKGQITPMPSFQISKTDVSGKPMPNVTFELYKIEDNATGTLVNTKVTSDLSSILGMATFAGLEEEGVYRVHEIVPEGYYPAEDFYVAFYAPSTEIVTILGNDVVSDPQKFMVVDYATTIPAINVPKVGNIDLVKVDSETRETLSGAVYTIYSDSACTTAVGAMPATNNNGYSTYTTVPETGTYEAVANGLLPGTYYIKETTAPIGYKLDTNIYTVLVTADTTTRFTTAAGSTYAEDKALEGKVEIPVTKTIDTVTAGADEADKFTFELTGDGIDTPLTAKNDENGEAKFTIEYRGDASGTYTYSISEKGLTYDNDSGKYTLDPTVYTVTVVVTEGADGLIATPTIKKGDVTVDTITFNNEELLDLSYTKVWDDADLYAADPSKRPTSLTFTLVGKVNNTTVDTKTKTITAGSDNVWQDSELVVSFTGLKKRSGADEITYELSETAVTGYTTSYSGTTVTNKAELRDEETGSVTLNVVKTDSKTNNGLAGAIFRVTLPDGTTADMPATGSDGKSSYTFTSSGTYTISELSAPTGYVANSGSWTVEVVKNEVTSLTYSETESIWVRIWNLITGTVPTVNYNSTTNTLTVANDPEKTSVSGTKSWTDGDDMDELRPEYITVNLLANGTVKQSMRVDELNNWSYSFENLDKYVDGASVTYTVEEAVVPDGYTVSYSTGDDGSLNINNAHTVRPRLGNIKLVKVDKDDHDVKLANAVYTIYSDAACTTAVGTMPATDANGVSKYKDIPETETDYSTYTGALVPGTYYVKETTAPGGYKLCDTVYTVVVTSDTTSTVNADATGIGYVEDERLVGGVEIKLTKTIDTVKATADDDGKFAFELSGDGIATPLTDTNTNGEVSFTLDYDTAGTYNYTVKETGVADPREEGKYTIDSTVYTVTVEVIEGADGLIATPTIKKGDDTVSSIVFNNEELTNVSYRKIWDDADLYAADSSKRPTSLTFTLVGKVGETTVNTQTKTITAGDDNVWQDSELVVSFTGLNKRSGADEISYELSETANRGYVATIDKTAYTVTNTARLKEAEDGSVTLNVVKTDSNTGNGLAGAIFRVTFPDGTTTADMPATGSNGKTLYNFTESGTYTISELSAPTGYVANSGSWTVEVKKGSVISVDYSETESIWIRLWNLITGTVPTVNYASDTNTLTVANEPQKTSVSIKKVWDDGDDQDGIRDEIVTVKLLANGTEVASKDLDESMDWEYTFTDLDEYKDGSKIEYTIEETTVPTGYDASYSTDTDGTLVVTNKHIPDVIEIPVTKIWSDSSDRDHLRPTEIRLVIYADGTECGYLDVYETDEWTGKFVDLPKNASGTEIVYTIEEVPVPGYTTVIVGDQYTGFEITNRHVPYVIPKTGITR